MLKDQATQTQRDGGGDDARRRAAQRAMLDLSRSEHLAIILTYYEKMTVAEVAATLGIPVRETVTTLNRARRKIRAALRVAA